ncbi:hypothetical protein INR49_028765 [Caranx melampygus]|nr:hypothetical protein INR49_028765 [Caranx melampygus]
MFHVHQDVDGVQVTDIQQLITGHWPRLSSERVSFGYPPVLDFARCNDRNLQYVKLTQNQVVWVCCLLWPNV